MSQLLESEKLFNPPAWKAFEEACNALCICPADLDILREKAASYAHAERLREASSLEQLRRAGSWEQPLIQRVDVPGVVSNAPINLAPYDGPSSSGPSIPPLPVGPPRERRLPEPVPFITQLSGETLTEDVDKRTGATQLSDG